MAAKATPDVIELGGPNPLEHVETIVAGAKPVEPPADIARNTEPTEKLKDLLDQMEDLEDFKRVEEEAEKLRPQPAVIDAGPVRRPVKLPNFDEVGSLRANHPRNARPQAPREASVTDAEPEPRVRRRRGGRATTGEPVVSAAPRQSLESKHIAGLLQMTHAVGSTVLGPSFTITEEQATAIGEAALPVLEDFGIQMASRAVHLMALLATVGMIEGPIMLNVWMDMKERAERQRSGTSTMSVGSPGRPTPLTDAEVIAQMTGVQVGPSAGISGA